MPLKAVLETLDGLNEAQAGLYVEQEGKFFLDLDADSLKDHPGAKPLVAAYERVKSDSTKAKQEAEALKTQIAELQKSAPDTAATQAKIAQMQEQLEAAQAKVGEWQGKYTSVTRDQALSQALQAAGITNPAFLKAATVMHAQSVKIGDDNTAYVETPMGPKLVTEYIKSWAASDGKDFVSPPSGGGAGGGKGSGGASGAKTMTRTEFDSMPPEAKVKAAREGVTLTD